MTVGVNQASIATAGTAVANARHSRHGGDKAGGFDEALVTVAKRSDQHETSSDQKPRSSARCDRPRAAHGATANAGDGPATAKGQRAGTSGEATVQTHKARPDAAEESEADGADRHDHAMDADEEAGLPTQIRAEQTITALMALAPIERHTQAAGDSVKVRDANKEAADESHPAHPPRAATVSSKNDRHPVTNREAPAGQIPNAAAPSDADAAGQADARNGTSPAVSQAATQPAAEQATAIESSPATARPATPGVRKVDVKDRGEVERRASRPTQVDATKPRGDMAAETPRPAAAESGSDQPNSDSAASGNAPHNTRRGEPQVAPAKVSVVSQQAAPAPALPQLSTNATAIVSAIAGDHGRRLAGTASTDPLQALRNAQPMRSLKIELHPGELGTVTANLKTAGGQLSVELQVDNHDAYNRLSADSDAIVKSLRSIGYDIDRVSIQQPQAATSIVVRAESSAGAGSLSRDTASFHSGNPGAGGDQSGGRTNGRGERGDAQRNEQTAQIRQDRAGGGVYI